MKLNNNSQKISGELLLSDYITAYVSTITNDVAKLQAEESENNLMSDLNSLSSGNYLNPGSININNFDQNSVARASLDAHIKKVQAQQLDTITKYQVQNLLETDKNLYFGKKVRVKVILPNKEMPPIETIWYSQKTGYSKSNNQKLEITGFIDEVLLDKNILVLKPSTLGKFINNRLNGYFVYVIDPTSLKPSVALELI